jgi:hypothetical protein
VAHLSAAGPSAGVPIELVCAGARYEDKAKDLS